MFLSIFFCCFTVAISGWVRVSERERESEIKVLALVAVVKNEKFASKEFLILLYFFEYQQVAFFITSPENTQKKIVERIKNIFLHSLMISNISFLRIYIKNSFRTRRENEQQHKKLWIRVTQLFLHFTAIVVWWLWQWKEKHAHPMLLSSP